VKNNKKEKVLIRLLPSGYPKMQQNFTNEKALARRPLPELGLDLIPPLVGTIF
jgi:hypothetical protein